MEIHFKKIPVERNISDSDNTNECCKVSKPLELNNEILEVLWIVGYLWGTSFFIERKI